MLAITFPGLDQLSTHQPKDFESFLIPLCVFNLCSSSICRRFVCRHSNY